MYFVATNKSMTRQQMLHYVNFLNSRYTRKFSQAMFQDYG